MSKSSKFLHGSPPSYGYTDELSARLEREWELEQAVRKQARWLKRLGLGLVVLGLSCMLLFGLWLRNQSSLTSIQAIVGNMAANLTTSAQGSIGKATPITTIIPGISLPVTTTASEKPTSAAPSAVIVSTPPPPPSTVPLNHSGVAGSRFWLPASVPQPKGLPVGLQTWLISENFATYQPALESGRWNDKKLAVGEMKTAIVGVNQPVTVTWSMDTDLPAAEYEGWVYIPGKQDASALASYSLNGPCDKPVESVKRAHGSGPKGLGYWMSIGRCNLVQAGRLSIIVTSREYPKTIVGIDDVAIVKRKP